MTSRTAEQPLPADTGAARHAWSRPRLHLVYYVLAGFDLIAVSLGLILIDRITSIYEQSVAANQVWADRQNDYSALGRLTAAVNAPGNDLFQTRDVDGEAGRLDRAVADFTAHLSAAREDVEQHVSQELAAGLQDDFDRIEAAVGSMVGKAREIFEHFRSGEPERAGGPMAEMDRGFVDANTALASLGERIRAIQHARFQEQSARAASLRKFEFLIAALIVLMVAGVTVYGHLLAQRMKAGAREMQASLDALARSQAELARHRDHLEELVADRTAELQTSHERLRLAERLASIGTLAAGLAAELKHVAAVSVPDRRMNAFVSAMLSSTGFQVRRSAPDPDGDEVLWFTDAATASPEAAEAFLQKRSNRRVIVVVENNGPWARVGATFVDGEPGLNSVRDALATACASLFEENV